MLRSAEGFVPVTGGRVWYRIAGSGDAAPMLLIHGGPGMPSHYLARWPCWQTSGRSSSTISSGCGRSDRPEEAEDYRRLIPGARLEVFEHSAHVPMLEEPEAFVAVVRRFLRRA